VGNSLQDQLLKAGLVSEQKLRQTKTAKRKQAKGPDRDKAVDEAAERARRAAEEKAERDRELNRQRQEEARRKAEANELRQLIHQNRLLRRDGDVAYNFQDGASLKRLYVTGEQRAQLIDGRVALVRQDKGFELVPAEVAERIMARNPALVLVWSRPEPSAQDRPAEDDPYASFQVPDDLMW
jgi:uncharacterized protein